MKIRAAVLEEFGQPLVVQDVELAAPKAGEVLVRVEACGLPHRPLHRERSGSERLLPLRARARGRGRRRARRRGRHQRQAGRSRDHAVRARVREVHPLRQPAHQSLPRDPRRAGPRPPARRHDAPLARRRAAAALHGHVHVRGGDGDARDRARQGRPGRSAGGREHLRLRPLHGPRRRDVHGQGRGRLHVRGVRLRPRRPRRDRRLPPAGGRAHLRDRPLGGAPRDGAPPRRDRHAARRGRRRADAARSDDGVRLRLHVRGHRPRRRSCARRSSRRARPGASRR